MADSILTLDQIDVLLADFIAAKLNLTSNQVLIAYSDKGQRSYPFGSTVVFLHTEQEQDEVQRIKNRVRTQNSSTYQFSSVQTSMRVLNVDISFYGATCDTLATRFKELLYFESSNEFFYKNNLSLIPNRITISNKVHENVNGRWWERVDLTIALYNSISVDETNNPFESMNWNVYVR